MQVILTLSLSLFLFQAGAREEKTDRDYDGLKGAVRGVRVESQDSHGNPRSSPTGTRELESVVVYDRSGHLKEKVSFVDYQGTCARSRHRFSYDVPGKTTESVYWGDGVVGGPAQIAMPPLIYTQVSVLNSSGWRSETDEYDGTGTLDSKVTFKYDRNGRIEEVARGNGESMWSRCLLKYGQAGLPVEETCHYSSLRNTDSTAYYSYEFDANGNWTKRTASTTDLKSDKKEPRTAVTYRDIKYYEITDQGVRDLPEEPVGVVDGIKLTPCQPLVIRKSGGVLQQSAIRRVTPEYPIAARAARISGPVVVELTTDPTGKVIAARALSGPAELRRAAEDAARGWIFRPTSLSKVPVRVIGTITFNFNL